MIDGTCPEPAIKTDVAIEKIIWQNQPIHQSDLSYLYWKLLSNIKFVCVKISYNIKRLLKQALICDSCRLSLATYEIVLNNIFVELTLQYVKGGAIVVSVSTYQSFNNYVDTISNGVVMKLTLPRYSS